MYVAGVNGNHASMVWKVGDGRSVTLERCLTMGIVNATPDSFSDGGRWSGTKGEIVDPKFVADICATWVDAGVALLDVGGESTRPGARVLRSDEEEARVVPVLQAVRADERLTRALLSIDTRHAKVASAAIEAGAHVVNDVSGLADPEMAEVVARTQSGLIIGHMRGTPETMMQATNFRRLFDEIADDLEVSVERAVRGGVPLDCIVLDPCIGFGKDSTQSAALVASSQWLRDRIGRPVLIGASRKKFLGDLTGHPVGARDPASVGAALVAAECGAMIVRVHDVLATLEALHVRAEILRARSEMLGVARERSGEPNASGVVMERD